MLMASHILLALRSEQYRNVPEKMLGVYLAGAVAPDIRYVQNGLKREITHDWDLADRLPGPFGQGYRHHLAVDQAFYGSFERTGWMQRIGPMNCTILAELYALRQLASVPPLELREAHEPLREAGIDGKALGMFLTLSSAYVVERDVDKGIELLSGPLKERAHRYLSRWQQWGWVFKITAVCSAPALNRLVQTIAAESERVLKERGQ